MDRDQLENLINCGLSQRELSSHFNVSQTNVRYWLKKYNLSTGYKKRNTLPDRKICSSCNKEKPNSEFYKRQSRDYDLSSKCRSCNLEDTLVRQKDFKQQCVDYKGGECQCCGYNKCNGALEFHHIDPKTKKFSISQYRSSDGYSLTEELDKCVLVCSNCHREIHAGYIDLDKQNISNLQEL